MSTKQAKILELRKKGFNVREISGKLKTSQGYVYNTLAKHPTAKSEPWKSPLPPIEVNPRPISPTKVYVVNGEYKAVAADLRMKADSLRAEAGRLDALATDLNKVKQV